MKEKIFKSLKRDYQLWLLCIPILIWVFIFAYVPMYGLLAAFYNYVPGKPILESTFVGFKHFATFINSPDFHYVMRNTLAISGLNILFGFPAPIILALLFNELRLKQFKKFSQTISYLPHFISWVVVASLLFSFLGTEGSINKLLMNFGFIDEPIGFLSEGKYFWGVLTVTNIWKGIGWSSIIYIAAITGIDPQLYEAGQIDGLGRWGLMRHITLPGIRTTIILLWILGIGGILNAGFEAQLLIGNVQTREYWEVIDTYAYRYGIGLGQYSYAIAIGFMKSIIGVALVFITNKIASKLFDTSIV